MDWDTFILSVLASWLANHLPLIHKVIVNNKFARRSITRLYSAIRASIKLANNVIFYMKLFLLFILPAYINNTYKRMLQNFNRIYTFLKLRINTIQAWLKLSRRQMYLQIRPNAPLLIPPRLMILASTMFLINLSTVAFVTNHTLKKPALLQTTKQSYFSPKEALQDDKPVKDLSKIPQEVNSKALQIKKKAGSKSDAVPTLHSSLENMTLHVPQAVTSH